MLVSVAMEDAGLDGGLSKARELELGAQRPRQSGEDGGKWKSKSKIHKLCPGFI